MKRIDTEIIIVAAGTAGMAAAVTAAQAGAKVVVLEKASTVGGSGNMARGPFAIESKLQKYRKIAITREEAFKMHMDYTHWRVDARLMSEYINRSAGTLDWLESLGVEFDDVQSHNYGSKFVWHTIKGPLVPREIPATGNVMIKILADKARELGVEFLFNTPAKKLIKKGNKVVGVIAEDESGEELQVNAGAVIIATGGMASMMVPGITGDGIRMAWEAGAAHSEISGNPNPRKGGTPLNPGKMQEIMTLLELSYTFRQPNLMVNVFGERFMDEVITQTTPFGGNATAMQKDETAITIFDEDTKLYYMEQGLDFPPGNLINFVMITVNNFEKEFQRALELAPETYFVANSVEEIAAKTGASKDILAKTIEEYNRACDTGRDPVFHKDPKYLRAVKRPPFYIQKQAGIGSISVAGGIKINYRTEVIDKNFQVIPGLYAAGNDANSLYGDTYNFYLPGNYLGFALNSGRMAGENAREFTRSQGF